MVSAHWFAASPFAPLTFVKMLRPGDFPFHTCLPTSDPKGPSEESTARPWTRQWRPETGCFLPHPPSLDESRENQDRASARLS